jgi:hypothetical protein
MLKFDVGSKFDDGTEGQAVEPARDDCHTARSPVTVRSL